MASSLTEILQPQVIMRVISRIRIGRGPLGNWLGFHNTRFDEENERATAPNASSSGANSIPGDVRVVAYRIFDRSRVVAKARAPGAGPATVAPNPVGQNQVACARFHQKISLNYEMLANLSPVVGPNSQVDPGGQDYIYRQETFLAQQFNMAIEAMAAGMMRNSLYFIYIGDDWYASFTAPGAAGSPFPASAPGFQVNFQIPATNTGQGVNQLGTNPTGGNLIDQTWFNSGANIISHIMGAKAAYAQLSGFPLTDIWCNSLLWPYIVGNTQVRNFAGAVNTPFAEYDYVPERGMGEKESTSTAQYAAILKADPTITWHFTDDVLVQGATDIDPSYGTAPAAAALSKLIPDGLAVFCNGQIKQWCQLYLGSEFVVENPGMPGVKREGAYFWKEYTTQPGCLEILGVLNAVPILYIPKAIAPLQVGF